MVDGERIAFTNPAAVIEFKLLSGSFREWVPQILELEKIERDLQGLAETEKQIGRLNPTKAEFSETLQESFQKYRQRYDERVARFLSESLTARDPLGRIERLNHLVPPFIPWEHFQAGLDLLPDQVFGSVEDKKRNAEIAKIRKARAALESRRAELLPPPYFRLDKTGGLRDIRQLFVSEWETKQRQCREGCDVCGLNLKHCSDDARWAYGQLGIGRFINEKRGFLAAVP